MKKLSFTLAACLLGSTAYAGGFLTNTNQSIAFLRNPARDAAIGIDGVYHNPAGVGRLNKGWHISLNFQNVHQTREIESTFGAANTPLNKGLFIFGEGNEKTGYKTFKGKAKAPVFPTLDVARVYDKFFFSAHLGVTGGGGKSDFNDGLGLFESQVALLPLVVNAINPNLAMPGKPLGYSLNAFVRGRQYYMGGQLNAGYNINKHWSVSAGLRVVYATNNYYGYVKDMSVIGVNPQALGLPADKGPQKIPVETLMKAAHLDNLATLAQDRHLNCDQTGWGFTPVLGVNFNYGRWNAAAKWEMKTRMRLKNRSGINTSGIDEFDDGKIIPGDIPGLLTAGIQYTALQDSSLRFNIGAHLYGDKRATQYNHREKLLSRDGYELLFGTEWDINKKITISGGLQFTSYGLGKNSQFISNVSFVTNSCSVGLGAKYNINKHVAVNIAYFKTFYKHYNKEMEDYNGLKAGMAQQFKTIQGAIQKGDIQLNPQEHAALSNIQATLPHLNTSGTDRFYRTNDVFGIGVDLNF